MKLNYLFWTSPGKWPRDHGGMVFLARAVHEVGGAKFGSSWTSETPSNAYRYRGAEAEMMVVANDLIDAIADQRLAYVIRGRPQGEFILDAPIKNWLNDDALGIFEECTMPRTAIPDSRQGLYPNGFWVYVPRASLDAYLGSPEAMPADVYVPPYIRLMLAVIQEMGISPENQSTKKEIVKKLLAAGKLPGMPQISPSLAKSAATLMRETDSQSGSRSHHERKKAQKSASGSYPK